jgi:hypothetical protein
MSDTDFFDVNIRGLRGLSEEIDRIHDLFPDHTAAIDAAIAGVVGVCWEGDAAKGASDLWNTTIKGAVQNYANAMKAFSDVLKALESEELAAKKDMENAVAAAAAAGLPADGRFPSPITPEQQAALETLKAAVGQAMARAYNARVAAVQMLQQMHGSLSRAFNPANAGDLAGLNSLIGAWSGFVPTATKTSFGVGLVIGGVQTVVDWWDAVSKGEDPFKAALTCASRDMGGALVATAAGVGVVALLTSAAVGAPAVVAIAAGAVVADFAGHAFGNLFSEDWDYDAARFGILAIPAGVGSSVWKAGGQVLEDGAGVVGWAWQGLKLPPIDVTSVVPDFTHLTVPTVNIDLPKIDLPKIDLPKIDLPKIDLPKLPW